MLFLKVLLILFSMTSLSLFVSKKFKIKLEFGITFTICLIISFLYLFSLIGLLLPITLLIFMLGIILGVLYIIKRDFSLIKESKASLIFTLSLILVLFFTLANLKPLSFDNFSHWLLISKQTLDFNNLPDASNILTSYFEYPPGSTYFIYFCCLFLGKSEFCLFFSQTVLEILLLLPLFVFVRESGNKILNVIAILFILFCLVIDIAVVDLLVDSLLGIIALASFMFLFYYKDNLRKTLLMLIPFNLALLLIKNSAIFFYGIEVLYILYLMIKRKEKFKDNLINFVILLASFILFLLWKIRCGVVFDSLENMAAQSVSLSNYQNNLSMKTLGDIKNIIINFLINLVNFTNLYTVIIFGLIVGCIIYWFINKKVLKENFLFNKIMLLILIILGIYLAYAFSLLFAYIFSMTLDEALRLASFERYIYSVIIFIVGIVLIVYFSRENRIINIVLIACFSLIIIFSKNSLILIGIQDNSEYRRQEIEKIVQDFPSKYADDTLVISSTTKVDGYVTFLLTYILNSKDYTLIQETNKLSDLNIDDFKYVITMDNDKNVKKFLSKKTNYDGKLGWYKVG